MEDYLKMVKDREGELSDLYARMDSDRELGQLKKYVMKNVKGEAVPDVVNVTLNKPAVFAANVEAALNSAVEQVSVQTEDSNVDKDHVADCVRAGFSSANARLRAQGKFPLNVYFDQQMCWRGRSTARVIFQTITTTDEKGKLVKKMAAKITPWDSRYVAYDVAEEGLAWGSYRTTRTKADIIAEYPEAESKLGTKKGAEIVDFWGHEANVVYADDSEIFEQANPYGYPPICEQIVTLGSMMADKDALKYEGESLFFLVRECIPELNRVLSIMQTRNMLAIKPPLGWGSKDSLQEAPDYDKVASAGSITEHETGGGASEIPFGDLQRYAIYALNVIENAIKQGSLEIVDVGTLPGPMSAVALIEIGEGRDQIFLPRLAARGLLNQQIADMFLRQIIASGERQIQLGTKGRERTFDVEKLKGAYEVEFKYFVKSPKIDVARYSVAQAAKTVDMPRHDIWKEVLQHEDVEGLERRYYWQLAETISSMVLARRTIKRLADMEDDDAALDAEILAMDMGMQMEKVLAGEMTDITPLEQKGVPGATMMPLLGGGAESSNKKAAQLQATPRETEGE